MIAPKGWSASHRVRGFGEPRKNKTIYDNIGHPFEIKNNFVIFDGKEDNNYCLTKGKKYIILDTWSVNTYYDKTIARKFERGTLNDRRSKPFQGDDYFIVLVNDKGNKRRYPQVLFRTVDGKLIERENK